LRKPSVGRTGTYDFSKGPDLPVLDYDDESTGVLTIEEEQAIKSTMILAVKKRQEMYPSMISIGRTPNNDIVIADVQLSRLHAFFRVHPLRPDRFELRDAGSRNGTFVGEQRLEPKGEPRLIEPGERIRFGRLAYEFADAARTWDLIREAE
jgi:hypothetical protein